MSAKKRISFTLSADEIAIVEKAGSLVSDWTKSIGERRLGKLAGGTRSLGCCKGDYPSGNALAPGDL